MSTVAFTDLAGPTSAAMPKAERPRAQPHHATCRHCGAPLIDVRMVETGFCCTGCAYVYRLVHEQGLASYYEIKDDVTVPADTAVFQPRDYSWLDAAQVAAEAATRGVPELAVDVQGISCAGCVWLIERVFQQQPGAREVFVNAQYGTMRLRWVRGAFAASEFARKLQCFGYTVGVAGEREVDSESRALVKRIGLCAAFAMNVMLFSLPVYFGMERSFEWAGLFGILSLVFGTLSVLVGGSYFLRRAVQALRERAMHIDLPIALGIIGAYAGSLYGWIAGEERYVYFDFVSTFILLMLVGRWAQTAAVERNRRRLLSQQARPQRVKLASGAEVSAEQVVAGQRLVIASGQVLPVESRLESNDTPCSLASINGEADPRIFRTGSRIPGGSVNVGRAEMTVTTTQAWSESLLAQLLSSGERVDVRHALLEKIVRGYIIAILAVAVVAGGCWAALTGDLLRTGAVVTAVLVVSCPCAIGLAFPLADEMAAVALRKRGVFVREADLWSRLARVRRLVFDKTGTLTLETPVLTNPEALRELDTEGRSALMALVADNPHPVSESLRAELLAFGGAAAIAGEVHEVIGMGVAIGEWSLGRPGWRVPVAADALANGTDTVLGFRGAAVATFRFTDRARSDAAVELAALHRRGLEVFILSGDRSEKVRSLAQQLGLDASHAVGDVSPHQKAAWIEQNTQGDALMLGDGANDSLAFDHALCRGTPVVHRGVLERKADFYYLGRGIGGLRAMFEVDDLRRRTHRTILAFSIAYNALAVGLAVAGRMNPLLAAVLMPLNSLLTLGLVTAGMGRAFRRA